MSRFDDFVASTGLTNAEFGERVDASEATISRVRKGKQEPSWDLIKRIVAFADGSLTADDFLPRKDRTPPSPGAPVSTPALRRGRAIRAGAAR